MILKLIQQGAEAKIILDTSKNLIIKDRISKSYRHPELDKKIIKSRTKSETKLLIKASKIINCPIPLESKEFDKIFMPYIKGKKLSEHLDKFTLKKQKEICREIGNSVAKLHKNDIIHGDLTTSNVILIENSLRADGGGAKRWGAGQTKTPKIFFIDFGLGFISKKIEDKAVDLHLLKHAIGAKHFKNSGELIKEILNSYEKTFGKTDAEKIFERMQAIERRGRYRH